jgi:hypothetical protein
LKEAGETGDTKEGFADPSEFYKMVRGDHGLKEKRYHEK